MAIDQSKIAKYIDHTMLKAEADVSAIEKLCREAAEYGFYSVCVNGRWVAKCKELLAGTDVKISVVAGFPLGAMHSAVKAYEAEQAVRDGAAEIDMVLSIGSLLAGDHAAVEDDIRQVVDAVKGKALVKVILETGFLTDFQKTAACRLAEQAGAHYVKTSTGFGPGGATVEDVRLMRGAVSSHIGVKAAGGVRDLEAAQLVIEAGATRIGTSSGIAIVSGGSGTGY